MSGNSSSGSEHSRTDWDRVRAMRDEDNPPDPDAPFLTEEELRGDMAEWVEASSEAELRRKRPRA